MEQSVKSDNSRSLQRPSAMQIINNAPVEIPESRATMNNFVNRIPSSPIRERFQRTASGLHSKWKATNSELGNNDDQASSLCKQMFALGLQMLEENGNVNLITNGRGMGDMGSALTVVKPSEASTINTFTKNILFTAIYINKQSTGTEMFQTSLQSWFDTLDQLMDLLSRNFSKNSVAQSSGYTMTNTSMTRTISDTVTSENQSESGSDTETESLKPSATKDGVPAKELDDFEQSLSKLEDKLTKSMEEIGGELNAGKEIDIKKAEKSDSSSSESFETSSEEESE